MESNGPATSRTAWQPITPQGLAAFAAARTGRVLVFQSAFGAVIAIFLLLLVGRSVYPSIERAISSLPQSGEIRAGRLEWPGSSPVLLSSGRVIAFAVDLDHSGRARVPSDLFLEFGRTSVRVFSILGYSEFDYRVDRVMAFNRVELEPWWGAWKAPLLALLFFGVVVLLLLLWNLHATVLLPAAMLIAFYANRKASPGALWKLCGAAAIPSSLPLVLGLFLYGAAAVNLIGLSLLVAGHLFMIWCYIPASIVCLSRDPAGSKGARRNPFKK